MAVDPDATGVYLGPGLHEVDAAAGVYVEAPIARCVAVDDVVDE